MKTEHIVLMAAIVLAGTLIGYRVSALELAPAPLGGQAGYGQGCGKSGGCTTAGARAGGCGGAGGCQNAAGAQSGALDQTGDRTGLATQTASAENAVLVEQIREFLVGFMTKQGVTDVEVEVKDFGCHQEATVLRGGVVLKRFSIQGNRLSEIPIQA